MGAMSKNKEDVFIVSDANSSEVIMKIKFGVSMSDSTILEFNLITMNS